MNVGRLHYISSNSQINLAGTGAKSQCPAPPFKCKLHSITIYINNANVSSPSYAFKIVKYRNGTASDVINPITVEASQLETGSVITYYFDETRPVGKYLQVLNASANDLNPATGDAFEFTVTTSTGITTLTGHITWCLAEG